MVSDRLGGQSDGFLITLAPPFPGLCHFPQGHGFKQWTGDNSKALMKWGVSKAVKDQSGPVLDSFDSAPNSLCSSITKSKHIKAVKESWRRSNSCNALGQMLVINQHLDKLVASHSYFKSKGMIKSVVLADSCESAGLFGNDVTDMPADALDTDPASHSANTDQGDNEGNLHHGTESTDPHEMDEMHPVDNKDAVSHVFLPENRHIERVSIIRHRAGRHLSPT
ncbi:hypothetical protein EDB92DRAFT_1819280 [Lactarius akahatsu]|uniref:Uncharacterized protein n=1 Tax=Lactarius akahatsu TaxID=416441 RepID=A0AAD4Q784_9AGAM|nr:hypothetical protein EDB92DRAFT_1819280 [Lactarius akahatsu]